MMSEEHSEVFVTKICLQFVHY